MEYVEAKGVLVNIKSSAVSNEDRIGNDFMPIIGYHQQVVATFSFPELNLVIPKVIHELQWYRSKYTIQVFHHKVKKIIPIKVVPEELLPYHRQRKISPTTLAQYMLGWIDYDKMQLVPFQTGQSAMFYVREYGRGHSISRYLNYDNEEHIIEPFDITNEENFNELYLSAILTT